LWLRRRRESAGLSQSELAELAGLAMRTVSNLESQRILRPHPSSLQKLADALGLSARASAELRARFQPSDGYRAGRPSLPDTSGSRPEGGLAAVPRQLPPTVPSFVGRKAEFAQVDRWLAEARTQVASPAIFGIGGMAGVGKTALALCWAHRVASEFPDGQLYVTLGGDAQADQTSQAGQARRPADAAEALGEFLIALGTAPERVPATSKARSELYRRLAAERRLLIVIDNAQDAAQVRALSPGVAGCVTVWTSRMQLTELVTTDDARLVNLDVLDACEGAQLLSARVSAERARDEPQAVRELVSLCGGLPLALVIVAARAATSGWRLSLIAAQLSDARQRLDALDLGDSITDIRSVFAWSCRQISPDATALLRMMASLPGPDFASSVASAANAAAAADAGLRELARASLITEHRPGRFRLHDLLRLYVAEQASLALS
jgi:transcriptional regulator with XRE-family HTH domain